MNKATAPATPEKSAIETTKAVFGRHPEDVYMVIGQAEATLDRCASLFRAIRNEAKSERPSTPDIEHLAAIGENTAYDISEYLGTEREDMEAHVTVADGGKERKAA
jgi:hypothetical protein